MHLHFVFTCHNSSIFEELQRLSKFSWYKNMHAIYSYMLQYRRYLKTHRSEILLPRPVLQWEANIRAIPVLIAMWARVIIPSIYGCKRIRNRFREKMKKSIATKYPWIYGYFYSVVLFSSDIRTNPWTMKRSLYTPRIWHQLTSYVRKRRLPRKMNIFIYQHMLIATNENKKHLKNVGPIRHCEPPHAACFTLPFTSCRYCCTPPAHRCPQQRQQRQRVTEGTAMAHHGMGPISSATTLNKMNDERR